MIYINSYYHRIIQKIKNNIKDLEKNKQISIKFNDYNRCKEIKKELESLNKLLEFTIKADEYLINSFDDNNEYLYGNIKYKNINNNKKFYINDHRKINNHFY